MSPGKFIGGVGAVIWSPANNKYLLLKRASHRDFASEIWECVTGRVDQGEGFEDALHREVREEVGLAVQVEFLIGTTHFYRGEPQPENELIGVVYFCSTPDPEALQISPEHSEYRWVRPDEAAALVGDQHPSARWIVQVLQRAEVIRRAMPPDLRRYLYQTGFELG